MSDTMKVQSFEALLTWILGEFEANGSIFGIPQELFFVPRQDSPFVVADMFGQYLATPVGPAAGPHTQLAQNIVCAWLSGGRFIELKTVQIMDELEIPRPCIDMEDEGYNVEWSQELKLAESAREYVNAWALIRVLRRLLDFEDRAPFGTVFNMSVGYNLEGIQSPPMLQFMDRLEDASDEIEAIQDVLRRRFSRFADVEIPSRLTNSVTLSTMHGCPPDEIERIGQFLLEERGYHTIVKLNPTLLGKEMVIDILHEKLGFHEIDIPDAVFEHDLKYDRAVKLIEVLKQIASERGLFFGVKLSNTLAMANHRGELPGAEMYMSGRPLYPITINLFHKLAREFRGDLNVSYSAGADALNVTGILASGALPVTAASDLLKPGGYSRMTQYLENLAEDMRERGAPSLNDLAKDKLDTLERIAAEALRGPTYKKAYHAHGLPKVESELERFDCIDAPCVDQCAVCQDVPEYAWLIAQGDYDRALKLILTRNPLPGVTGFVCTHLCQTRCTRSNYDEPVAIRALKRFAAEHAVTSVPAPTPTAHRVAVIGSGPSGLAAAFFLALNGLQVTIYEARDMPGGMLAIAPHFRLPPGIVRRDIERIEALGVTIMLSQPITSAPEELLERGFEAVYVACGFQNDATLGIPGIGGDGVFTALDLLEKVAHGVEPTLGAKVLVIGGGNTAMDAARTAQRLTGRPATVVYRRTQAEMPAEEGELRDLFDEGNHLVELASPSRVVLQHGKVAALECVRNELGEPGPDGRRRPVPVEGSEFQVEADSIILAIGQKPDSAFLNGSGVRLRESGAIVTDPATARAEPRGVYAGGDVARGPAIIIEACADGRTAAEAICTQLGIPFEPLSALAQCLSEAEVLQVKRVRARKQPHHEPDLLPVDGRAGFDLVEQTLTEEQARAEAARCMQCSTICDKCVEVCPNRANYAYTVSPGNYALPVLACQNGQLVVVGEEAFTVGQARQIIHVDDYCNECGNCATFCVHQGKPYADKPRLFLSRGDFDLEESNAFWIEGDAICRREGGQTAQLAMQDGTLTFENPRVRVSLSPTFRVEEMRLKSAFEGTQTLRAAAEMSLILRGLKSSAAYLTG
ncbi:putative selenate reductase subunit YgfK [Chloroflexota bacterium]